VRVDQFLRSDARFRRQPIEASEVGGLGALISADGDMRSLPCHLTEIGGMDGFFAARLYRIA
jgi:16S rRNA (cytosine967-C5)-methyltransferase